MSLTIELPSETETAIKRLAAQSGRKPEEYAGELLAEHVAVKISQTDEDDPQALSRAVARMKARTSEEITAIREKMFRLAKPPRQLPKNQNIFDAVYGKISSDESDDEVFAALKKLS